MKKRFLIIALVALLMLTLVSCGGGGSSSSGPETITISIVPEASVGEKVLLEKEASFSPFYQKEIKYEFVGENTCGAEFVHELSNNWWSTYVVADYAGKVSIKLSYDRNGKTVESNTVTIRFVGKTINNAEDLMNLKNSSDTYVLATDIDLSEIDEWKPITGFTGNLDGAGHKIIGLNINAVNEENVGLFATVSGKIENLTIENANVSARGKSSKAGILAGTSTGTLNKITVSGTVGFDYYECVGGIVGFSDGGSITECVNNATVTGADVVGGIAGKVSVSGNDSLSKNVNNGNVSGGEQVGGIAGILTAKNVTGTHTQTDLTNNGEINGETKVGGIVGSIYGAYFVSGSRYVYNYFGLSLLENTAKITASNDYAGGLIGHATQLEAVSVSKNSADIDADNAPNNNSVKGKTYVGGIAGYAGVIKNGENNGEVTAFGLSDGKTYLGGVAGFCTGLVKCKNTVAITSSTTGNYTGGIAGFVELLDPDNFKRNENTADISASDYTGGICGALLTLEGGGDFNVTDSQNSGKISGRSYVGGIAGQVSGRRYASGGTLYYNNIKATVLENNGTVTATGDYAGGLFGYGFKVGEINTCHNSADITGESYVGGLVGWAENTIIYATGETNENVITGKAYVGGFAGLAGIIEGAVNNGTVTSVGAITENNTTVSYVGGIAGYCRGLADCKNTSDITVTTGGRYVGGLAGYILTNDENCIHGNENSGAVIGNDYVGGIAGYVITKSGGSDYSVTACKNSAAISGGTNVGGIVGYATGVSFANGGNIVKNKVSVSYCENAGTVSGSSYVGGIVGGTGYFNAEQIDTNTDVTSSKIGME